MTKVKKGDKVKVHYEGFLENGKIFESTIGGDPIEFNVGKRQIIPHFSSAIIGMSEGDSRTVEISMGDTYGIYDDKALAIKKLTFEIHLEKVF